MTRRFDRAHHGRAPDGQGSISLLSRFSVFVVHRPVELRSRGCRWALGVDQPRDPRTSALERTGAANRDNRSAWAVDAHAWRRAPRRPALGDGRARGSNHGRHRDGGVYGRPDARVHSLRLCHRREIRRCRDSRCSGRPTAPLETGLPMAEARVDLHYAHQYGRDGRETQVTERHERLEHRPGERGRHESDRDDLRPDDAQPASCSIWASASLDLVIAARLGAAFRVPARSRAPGQGQKVVEATPRQVLNVVGATTAVYTRSTPSAAFIADAMKRICGGQRPSARGPRRPSA